MRVGDRHLRTIWSDEASGVVSILDQTRLPDALEIVKLATVADACTAIRDMWVRGAPLIGVTAAFGLWLAMRADPTDAFLASAARDLVATRPTAVNLAWAVDRVVRHLAGVAPAARASAAHAMAVALADEDVATNTRIGEHGARALRAIWTSAGQPDPFVVMTHCNAGWLATVDVGTALAPVYALAAEGVSLHVFASETRPRNQGYLTAWELEQQGVPHTLVADNACGHLLHTGRIHAVIVGCDRLARSGDVCNKIGTYLKALAARDAAVPFFVALPASTIDWTLASGAAIPIESRAGAEVSTRFPAENPAFDVTPARLVTGIVTDRGVAEASEASLRALFPEAP